MKLILFLIAFGAVIPMVNSQSVLLECGQNSGNNFNGWLLGPYDTFDSVEFDERSVSFFSEHGGNYGVTITRQVEELVEYSELHLLFNFEEINNCEIENVVYYTSADGRTWDRVIDYSSIFNPDFNNRSITVFNDSLNIRYVRAVANTSFANNGKLACNYVKVEGEGKEVPSLSPLVIDEEPLKNSFFIFSFEHNLNIETETETPYEVMITSISGQIVYREKYEGSTRIALPDYLSGIYVINIIQGHSFQASKKVVL